MIKPMYYKFILICFSVSLLSCLPVRNSELDQAKVNILELQNSTLKLSVTPDIGGRVLAFGLQGHPNILKVGDAVVTEPAPQISAFAGNIGYLGHIVWLGPQAAWWQFQNINAQRKAEKATWPPDPFSVFSANRVDRFTENAVEMVGAKSPVWGTQITKRFELSETNSNAILHRVSVKNISKEVRHWDIWFNSRVSASTRVYVPVSSEDNVRFQAFVPGNSTPNYFFDNNMLVLDLANASHRQIGKLFIQPSAGWMAGFSGEQMFIIEFPLHKKEVIHPEQGQVELFAQFDPAQPEAGLVEMELHAPFLSLSIGESMYAQQIWHVYPFRQQADDQAKAAYLEHVLKTLNLFGRESSAD